MAHSARHYLLTPVGSAGDVFPFLGIGRELLRRGAQVTLLASEPFREPAQRAGIEFRACWSAEYVEAVIQNPDLWHPRRGLSVVLEAVAANLQATYDALSELYAPGRSVLVGHSLSFATRSFEQKHDAPAATLHLAPSLLRSLHRVPAIPPGRDVSRLPRPLKRALWWLIDRKFVDPMILPALNGWRRGLGLPPVRRPFHSWLHSPRATLGLFPDWFGPPQPDWPPQVRLTGFPLFDDAGMVSLSQEIAEFLSAGSPPILFTAGSANRQAPRFFAAGMEATAALERRAILLTRYPEQLPANPPDSVLHVPWVSLAHLLPSCAAIVHHGGIGTCAQSLAAGIPQLLMPMGFDQPDNAVRLRRLGVGAILPPRRFTARRLAKKLAALVEEPTVAARCRQLRQEAGSYEGIGRTCGLLESLS